MTGLDIKPAQVIEVLKRRPGRFYTAAEIAKVLKINFDVPDNKAAIVWAACRAQEIGKCEAGRVGEGAERRGAWKVLPKKGEGN